jgi:thiol-disulfide isomerase/thioredoxin
MANQLNQRSTIIGADFVKSGAMKAFLLILHFTFLTLFSFGQARIIKFPELDSLMNNHKDTVLVVNFWATWCKPCIEEFPYFQQLAKNYSDKKVKVVFVSLDFKREFETKLVPYVKNKNVQQQVLLIDEPDYNSWIDKVDPRWSGAIPATLIIDEKGRKYFYEKEFPSYLELEKIVKPLIK